MVGSRANTLATESMHKVLPKIRLELCSSVDSDSRHYAILRNPVSDKRYGDSGCRSVGNWQCFYPSLYLSMHDSIYLQPFDVGKGPTISR
ncbi:hypothetical protein M514_11151 [Trichuris suis]|uniref:Uncharacterized protein n=1 Tax=Trichuris suis TaxID=68888 RepID=A0A085N8C5_9BILA|nr:hypothetical protein M513_11151 [Trichuris suis]KFD65721.1 hypothetical protein M514_11151 [Trichuris suis]